ncbi:MAG: hypothetical protein O9340_12075 [Cyclobacteriaceae bacterium]|jgi:hypothetical protein|nr:hypothetical protein [Cyclobacteriaceae bacterium]
MNLETVKKNLTDGGVDLLTGVGSTIVSLHVARKMNPKYSGWVLLGAGVVGLAVGGKVLKSASIVAASIGTIQAMNAIAKENGVVAESGWKGMINKVIPQLNGTEGVPALGNVEDLNEKLLLGLNAAAVIDEEETDPLEHLTGGDSELDENLLGANLVGNLM